MIGGSKVLGVVFGLPDPAQYAADDAESPEHVTRKGHDWSRSGIGFTSRTCPAAPAIFPPVGENGSDWFQCAHDGDGQRPSQ